MNSPRKSFIFGRLARVCVVFSVHLVFLLKGERCRCAWSSPTVHDGLHGVASVGVVEPGRPLFHLHPPPSWAGGPYRKPRSVKTGGLSCLVCLCRWKLRVRVRPRCCSVSGSPSHAVGVCVSQSAGNLALALSLHTHTHTHGHNTYARTHSRTRAGLITQRRA